MAGLSGWYLKLICLMCIGLSASQQSSGSALFPPKSPPTPSPPPPSTSSPPPSPWPHLAHDTLASAARAVDARGPAEDDEDAFAGTLGATFSPNVSTDDDNTSLSSAAGRCRRRGGSLRANRPIGGRLVDVVFAGAFLDEVAVPWFSRLCAGGLNDEAPSLQGASTTTTGKHTPRPSALVAASWLPPRARALVEGVALIASELRREGLFSARHYMEGVIARGWTAQGGAFARTYASGGLPRQIKG